MRGFDKYLGYYNAALSDYWYHGKADASCAGGWNTDLSNNTGEHISGATGTNGTYSTRLFTSYAVTLSGPISRRQGPLDRRSICT
jgi:hypothetical protein